MSLAPPRPRTRRQAARATLAAALTAVLALSLAAPSARAAETHPFRNPDLPVQARVADLLGRLTLDEKIAFLHQYHPAVPRLGLKGFKTGTEALHGLAWTNEGDPQVYAKGTVFPQAVGLASTWDPALIKKVGQVVGTEARGYNSTTDERQLWGLNLWAPVVNLLRDPRWGRNEEGYSEDPLLNSLIATAYGKGIQGDNPKYLLAAPTLKHYLANNNEYNRSATNSQLTPRVLNEYDREAFRPILSADGATGVMSAYNKVNGRPAVVNPDLGTVVRSWTTKELFNVTDAGTPDSLAAEGDDPRWNQRYYPNRTEGDAAILKAGNDSFTVNGTDNAIMVNAIKDALAKGLINESHIDTAVGRALSLRVRLGEFDPGGGPYAGIDMSAVNTPASQALNRKTVAAASVLLKNSRGALPFRKAATKKVAVVGPLSQVVHQDWYGGDLPYAVTPLQGVKNKLGSAGTVAGTEGLDRIALKDVRTGRYVVAGSGPAGAALKAAGTERDATAQFDLTDWGDGVVSLRSAANGEHVYRTWSDTLVNDDIIHGNWFVQQQLSLEERPNGNVVLRYAGLETQETWWHDNNYLTLDADGTLKLGARTADQAAEFSKELVVDGRAAAARAVRGADQAVVVVGSNPFINGRENYDRPSINLAKGQEDLVKAVLRANPRTTVVLQNSYPTAINWLQRHVPAVLWTTHAGAETGNGLADVLFGDAEPGGRLTQTWYRSERDLPHILDYDIIKSNRTYLYFKGRPLYPFGHGLTYTRFSYGKPRLSSTAVSAGGTVRVSVPVRNTGRRAGTEVVQLYSHQRTSRNKQPVRELRGFQRVTLRPGRQATVRLTVKAADLAHWDVTRGRWVVESATHDLLVGGSAGDIRRRAALKVRGETIPPRDLGRDTRAIDFDDYRGVELLDETKVSGDTVGVTSGDWIKFADVRLGRGARTFTARVAGTGSGTVRIRLGSPTGRLAGTARVSATGDVYAYTTTTAALTRATGRQNVYLVFDGEFRISSFRLR
jgi:beta-glucosidase